MMLEIYNRKPEFTPAGSIPPSLYVEPGTLLSDPEQWQLVGRTFHPTEFQAREVQRYGYCLRDAPSWIRSRKWYARAAN